MHYSCDLIAERFEAEIQEVVDAQVNDNREAIFFIYENGATSQIYKGQATQISLSREEEARIQSQGTIVGSVHSHPTGFDPSTIDIMTGVMTTQESMCVAVPTHTEPIDSDFVITCLDFSELTPTQRRRMVRAMRRSSVGFTDLGRQLRKQAALQRFEVTGCRSHTLKMEGIEFPVANRPSKFNISVGMEKEIASEEADQELLE
jgi:hypothetical protein